MDRSDPFGRSLTPAAKVAAVGGEPGRDRAARAPRRIAANAAVLVTAAGFAASLTMLYTGMRDTMRTSGGFCASGGPYVIANQCKSGDTKLLFIGIFGLLIFGGLYSAAVAWAGGNTFAMLLVMWAALFGALGWNFIDLAANPPKGQSGTGGWLISGVVFWLMALGGLIPAIGLGVAWIRRGGAPDPGPTYQRVPIVAARVPNYLRTRGGGGEAASAFGAQPNPDPPVEPVVPKRLVIPDDPHV